MIQPGSFLDECLERGFTFFTGTPCSYLKPIINHVIDHERFRFVDAVNEGDAVAIASGVTLAGGRSVVMFQNSGLGNAVNPLTSLAAIFELPMLLLVTLRGEPGGEHDEPQHALMGEITTTMLETMRIPWRYFPGDEADIAPALDEAERFMRTERRPFALVVRKRDVAPYALQPGEMPSRASEGTLEQEEFTAEYGSRPARDEALRVIQRHAPYNAAVIGTTGYTGRELYALDDRDNQLYMVGSMGCALPLGLGVALQAPAAKSIVIDGDGALLMRTGTMATVGALKPENLIHILLDNERHDSTGGQTTVSGGVAFATVARGFGYDRVYATDRLERFEEFLQQAVAERGPTFIHLKTRAATRKDLPRPTITPAEVAVRFARHLSHVSQSIRELV